VKRQKYFCFYTLKTGEIETRKNMSKWKNEKSGREFLLHYFNMGKSNLVFQTVSDNSWNSAKTRS
jgi:hypothetical protein